MSRIGRQPIQIPSGVDVKLDGGNIKVKGPLGELKMTVNDRVTVKSEAGVITIERAGDSKPARAIHGLTRSLINNMVTGVSKGYQRVMEIVGVGYRAEVKGDKILFSLGYSHPVEYALPKGVKAEVDKKQVVLTLSGADKQELGQVCANLKALRPPDSYKGKGVRYQGERLKLKAGKTGKK